MSPRRARGTGRAFRWLAALFLLAATGFLAVAAVDRWGELVALKDRVAAYPWRLAPTLLVAAAAASSAALLVTGAAWVRLFRAAGGRIGYPAGTAAWLATNLGRYIPGKVWQVTGLAVYVRRRGDSAAVALSTSVAVQGATLLAGVALAVAILGGDLLAADGLGWRAAAVLAALAAFLHPGTIRGFTRRLGRWLGESPEVDRLQTGEVLRLAAALTAAWILHGLAFWLFLRAIVGGEAPSPAAATGIFAASYLAGYAAFVAPAGLVVREGAMAALLAALTPLPAAVAAVVAVGARLWATVAELAAIGAGWIWARSSRPDAATDPAGTRRQAGSPEGGPGS